MTWAQLYIDDKNGYDDDHAVNHDHDNEMKISFNFDFDFDKLMITMTKMVI